jgi:hypothetical protein
VAQEQRESLDERDLHEQERKPEREEVGPEANTADPGTLHQ